MIKGKHTQLVLAKMNKFSRKGFWRACLTESEHLMEYSGMPKQTWPRVLDNIKHGIEPATAELDKRTLEEFLGMVYYGRL